MMVGAVTMQPYVYNTNTISRVSMNKIAPISDDVLSKKVDYSGLAAGGENENPLKPGETRNFMDILNYQMEMSRSNAARLMM